MTHDIKNVALAGASGNVGNPALKHLIRAGFKVTVLARKQPTNLPPGVAVAMVDFSSAKTLIAALKGQDALIDATNTPGSTDVSKLLIDAAVAAGVYRIIPPEFSGDPNNTALRSLPPFVAKAEIFSYLKEKTAGTGTTWTTISNNAFLDWCMRYNVFYIDLKKRSYIRLNDGNYVLEWTLLDSVGKSIAGALSNAKGTENRNCYIHSVKKSQNEMFDLAKEAIGGEWQVEQVDARKVFEESIASVQDGKVNFEVIGNIIRYAAVTPGIAAPFPVDSNPLLGVATMSDDELKELLKEIAAE